MKQLSNEFRHSFFAALMASVVYLAAGVFAFSFMDERNGVVEGTLLPNSDHWNDVAKKMLSGSELTSSFLPPGFSLYMLLAVKASNHLGGSYFFWRLVEDSLSTAVTALIIMRLMFQLSNSAWVGWGGIFVLLYNLGYSAGTATDLAMASFLPWFFGGLLLLIRALQAKPKVAAHAVLSGVMFGISGFIRTDIVLFLPFVWMVLALFSFTLLIARIQVAPVHAHVTRKILCLALLGFCITLLPWAIYTNYRSASHVLYSTYFIRSHLDGMSRFPGNPVSEAFRSQMGQLGFGSLLDLAKAHLSLFQSYPLDWLQLWIQKLWRPWYASDSGRWNTILAIQTLLLVGPILTGSYAWVRKRGPDLGFMIGVSVISYYWFVTVLAASLNRMMPPAYPFLGMFAGFGAEALWLRRRSRLSKVSISDTSIAPLQ